MSFFNRFPIIAYDIKGDENYKLATNILKRVKLRSGIRSGLLLFDLYDVLFRNVIAFWRCLHDLFEDIGNDLFGFPLVLVWPCPRLASTSFEIALA